MSGTGRSIIVANVSKKISIAIIVFLWLTLGCFAAGLAGNVWVLLTTYRTKNGNKSKLDITLGLWKNCTTQVAENIRKCTTRNASDFLTFKNVIGTDPIIICLIISAGFILITLLVSFSMFCCCRAKPKLWRKSIKWNVVLLIIAVTAAVDAMLYTELSFFKAFPGMIGQGWYNGRGWSYMLSWVGTGTLVISFILTLVQLCTKYEDVDMNL